MTTAAHVTLSLENYVGLDVCDKERDYNGCSHWSLFTKLENTLKYDFVRSTNHAFYIDMLSYETWMMYMEFAMSYGASCTEFTDAQQILNHVHTYIFSFANLMNNYSNQIY